MITVKIGAVIFLAAQVVEPMPSMNGSSNYIIRSFVNKELTDLNLVYSTAVTALGVAIFAFESLLLSFRARK